MKGSEFRKKLGEILVRSIAWIILVGFIIWLLIKFFTEADKFDWSFFGLFIFGGLGFLDIKQRLDSLERKIDDRFYGLRKNFLEGFEARFEKIKFKFRYSYKRKGVLEWLY